jgi:hypothetical protein
MGGGEGGYDEHRRMANTVEFFLFENTSVANKGFTFSFITSV